MTIFILDFETSGLNPYHDDIIDIGCKVLDQELMNMEEGKSNRYSGLEGSLENGDSFYLEWEITEMWKGANLGMFVRAGRKEDNTQLQWFYMDESSYQERFPWNFYFDSSKEGNVGNTFSLSDDYINISANSSESQAIMRRYYKNDWSFILNRRMVNTHQILHANCMGMPEEYNLLLSKLEEKHGKRDYE